MDPYDEEDPWGEEPDWARSTSDRPDDETTDRTSDGSDYDFGAQHILFLIDTAPSMFLPCVRIHDDDDSDTDDGNGDGHGDDDGLMTPFDAALTACERLLLLRVHYVSTTKSSKRDGVGIMLYGMPNSSSLSSTVAASGPVGEDGGDDDDGGGVKRETGDDSEEEEEEEDDRRHETLAPVSLVDISPPGIRQIRTVRSYLLPRHYGGVGKERTTDLEAEIYPSTLGESNGGGGEEEEDDEDGMRVCQLRVALYEASKAFGNSRCVKKQPTTSSLPPDSKTVWIFTNRDDPTLGDPNETDHLVTAAGDVVDNGLDIRVWPLPVPPSRRLDVSPGRSIGVSFDRSVLFDRIVTVRDEEDRPGDVTPTTGGGGCGAVESSERSLGGGAYFDIHSLLEQIATQWKRVRKVQTIAMLLPDWNVAPPPSSTTTTTTTTTPTSYPGIALDLFQTTTVQRKPLPVVVTSKTHKRTNRTTHILCKDTGDIIEPKRLQYYAEFGGERVPITRTEVGEIRRKSNANPDKASLVLSGFKPLPQDVSSLSLVDKSLFAYPNDDAVHGSKRAFLALHTSMLQKGVMGIGELLLRVTSSSRLVAVVPQREERTVDDDGGGGPGVSRQVTPPGWILIPLAFEDDVRATPYHDHVAGPSVVSATVDLVRNQIIRGGVRLGESFPNPVLKSFWGYMESVSLRMLVGEEEETESN